MTPSAPTTAEMVAWCANRSAESALRAMEISGSLPNLSDHCRQDAAMLRLIAGWELVPRAPSPAASRLIEWWPYELKTEKPR